MAMIFDLGLPREDLERISEFMQRGEGDVPELSDEDSIKVLDEITGGERHPLWKAVVGRFVECEEGANTFMGKDGKPTGKYGIIVEDYDDPEAAFVTGVPF